jgi:ribosomal protein S18 acetylase RimI-like enzyme
MGLEESVDVVVRRGRREDALAIAAMADELRSVLGDPCGYLTAQVIVRDGFGVDPEFELVVAEWNSSLIGYALYLDVYEPAYAARGIYLADLFVSDENRGRGIGRRLIDAVAAAAQERGRTFVWWVAQPSNAAALSFYRKLTPDLVQTVVTHVVILRGEA